MELFVPVSGAALHLPYSCCETVPFTSTKVSMLGACGTPCVGLCGTERTNKKSVFKSELRGTVSEAQRDVEKKREMDERDGTERAEWMDG